MDTSKKKAPVRGLESLVVGVVGTLMRLNYIGRRTAVAIAVCVVFALTGCVNYDAIRREADAHMATYRDELQTYAKCNYIASRAYASQPGDPISIAFAARSACSSERSELKAGIDRVDEPIRASKILAAFERSALETNSVTVIEARRGR